MIFFFLRNRDLTVNQVSHLYCQTVISRKSLPHDSQFPSPIVPLN
uniref:Uncharacterized protein n=1 Tax=Rhizophora mucronata TaxID=61149 RepID=A0A2P2IMI3_RHIMU